MRRGAIDVGFFAQLTRRFPGRRARIAETAKAFGIDGPAAESTNDTNEQTVDEFVHGLLTVAYKA